jgi:hypothetical protein
LQYQLGVGKLSPTIKTDLEHTPLLTDSQHRHFNGLPLLIWRPQHPTEALIILGRYPNERLYWANTNGQWRLLQDGWGYLKPPIWSPDGRYFALWLKHNYGLGVFTASGQLVRREKLPQDDFQFERWSNCQ